MPTHVHRALFNLHRKNFAWRMVTAHDFDAARGRIELAHDLEHAPISPILLGRFTKPNLVGGFAFLHHPLRMMPGMDATFDIHAMFCYYTPQFAPQNHSGIAQR